MSAKSLAQSLYQNNDKIMTPEKYLQSSISPIEVKEKLTLSHEQWTQIYKLMEDYSEQRVKEEIEAISSSQKKVHFLSPFEDEIKIVVHYGTYSGLENEVVLITENAYGGRGMEKIKESELSERLKGYKKIEKYEKPEKRTTLLKLSKLHDHCYHVLTKDTNVRVCDLYRHVDGYFYMHNEELHGSYSSHNLTEIGQLLNELNQEWDAEYADSLMERTGKG